MDRLRSGSRTKPGLASKALDPHLGQARLATPGSARPPVYVGARLFGATCLARVPVSPWSCRKSMPANKHLAERQSVSVSATALLILDAVAGWHGSPKVVVPDNICTDALAALCARTQLQGKMFGIICAATS